MDILVIIIIVVSIFSKLAKTANGKGGQTARPGSAPRPAPARPSIPTQPTPPTSALPGVPHSSETPEPTGSFWQQMSEALREEGESPAHPEEALQPMKGHEAVGDMSEGESRECEHGSLGGSMAYESHEGGSLAEREAKRLGQFVQTEATDSMYRPAMNARQMRQAIVMAEILKRPAERRAEQARRWNAR